jgi:hypothetical protein
MTWFEVGWLGERIFTVAFATIPGRTAASDSFR